MSNERKESLLGRVARSPVTHGLAAAAATVPVRVFGLARHKAIARRLIGSDRAARSARKLQEFYSRSPRSQLGRTLGIMAGTGAAVGTGSHLLQRSKKASLMRSLSRAQRGERLDPSSDDFAKNQAFGRAVGLSAATSAAGALAAGATKLVRPKRVRPVALAALLAPPIVGVKSYRRNLKRFRENQKNGEFRKEALGWDHQYAKGGKIYSTSYETGGKDKAPYKGYVRDTSPGALGDRAIWKKTEELKRGTPAYNAAKEQLTYRMNRHRRKRNIEGAAAAGASVLGALAARSLAKGKKGLAASVTSTLGAALAAGPALSAASRHKKYKRLKKNLKGT